ncbi:sugar-binding domain-containing protein [Saccharicrinis sp. FJH54]|uniref:sugar-binding domain-containing protein n=1 Tax=Saccharicrinis sp. FJH54 TaxID=3344665 RepID=UPI0035D4807A
MQTSYLNAGNLRLKTFIFLTILFFSVHTGNKAFAQKDNNVSPRQVRSMDADWLFHLGDADGAEDPKYKDKDWRLLNVPHDWSIEGEVSRDNPTGRGGGFFPAGIGWYRKYFSLPKDIQGKKVFIAFDGVMANSEVWINGHLLGKRPNGYVSFSYELTNYLNYGKKDNVIAVKADNSVQPASRWYTGAGIYRHVNLVIKDPVHIPQWGIYISTPEVSARKATVKFQTEVLNSSASDADLKVITTILDDEGNAVGSTEKEQAVKAGGKAEVIAMVNIDQPDRWDVNNPVLYTAKTKVYNGDKLVDEVSDAFGIREFHFDAASGFWLNGKNLKIKGVALHADGGALGAAVPLTTWRLRFETLKKLGVNAVRTAHNPFAPEFYDLCDEMGFLVMDETFDTWRAAKNHAEKGYNLYFNDWWEADTRDVVLRDRNHPSIFIYSVGNEIRDNLNNEQGFSTYKKMQDLVHETAPGSLVTMALFRPNSSGVYQNGFADMMDIVGQNYREKELVQAHLDKPTRKVLGTENGHTREAWLILRDNPFMSGQFLWTGIDYLGEANWPAISHHFGLLDRLGNETTLAYQRQSWWSEKPFVHLVRYAYNAGNGPLVSNWSPADEDTYDVAEVEIYANTREVEIFLNGISKGVYAVPEDAAPVKAKFTFEPGIIKVVGRNDGEDAAEHEMQTAGEPAKIKLTASSSDLTDKFDDVVYVTAEIVDENGVTCPNSDQMLGFSVTGPGVIAAVDNADRETHVPFYEKQRRVLDGRCVAIVKANAASGQIELSVKADGLQEEKIKLNITE